METTTGLLARTAQRIVADLDPVEAVVLFGSRARGTAHGSSDWDVAVLLDRNPDPSVRAAVPALEHVNVLYKDPNDLRERALHLGSLESAIVRDGQILAGEWERPDQTGERVVDYELVESHMAMAASGVGDTVHRACSVLGGFRGDLKLVSRGSQFAAEFTSKAAMMHLGIDPTHVHDLIRLADQMEREKPHDPRTAVWAATVRSMNGLSTDRHIDVYARTPLELLERPFEIVSAVVEFFPVVLRDITETRDGFAPYAAGIAAAVEEQLLNMREYRRWEKIPKSIHDRLDIWAKEVQSISHLVQSRPQ